MVTFQDVMCGLDYKDEDENINDDAHMVLLLFIAQSLWLYNTLPLFSTFIVYN